MTKKKSKAKEALEALEAPTAEPHEQKQPDPVEVAASTMLGDLMKMVVEQCKAMPKSWQEMSESDQDNYLYRIETQCRMAVVQCVQIIASNGLTRIPVEIISTMIKKGVEVKAELVDPHMVIDLVSAETKMAMLVLADSSQFTSEKGKPASEADQRSLELGREYMDEDGDGMDGDA